MSPVHEYEGKWWFWDETWCHAHGPYESKAEAAEELYKYCVEELGVPGNELKKPGENNAL